MYNWTKDDYPEQFDELSPARQKFLLDWIDRNLSSIKGFNGRHTSYGIKQWVSRDGEYFTNGEFKGAMLKSGYRVKDKSEQNWVFNVSERSPIMQRGKHNSR